MRSTTYFDIHLIEASEWGGRINHNLSMDRLLFRSANACASCFITADCVLILTKGNKMMVREKESKFRLKRFYYLQRITLLELE